MKWIALITKIGNEKKKNRMVMKQNSENIDNGLYVYQEQHQ
jgi:hypothetical protein